jgi:hypothetical protein
MDILAAIVPAGRVLTVVVAPDVEDGDIEATTQEVQVLGRQITTGEDEVDIAPALRGKMVVQRRSNLVGNGEYGKGRSQSAKKSFPFLPLAP